VIRRFVAPATDADVVPAAATGISRRVIALLRNAPQRLRERSFWVIQAGVLAITVVHVLAELWAQEFVAGVHPALHHVPVILYLAPIAYASLRYGIEGALLTGLWCAALTLPNILVFHPQYLEWLTEMVYVGVVVAAGVTMAIPVEREQRQRRHAEATSRRLGLLNEIATLTLTADLDRTLHESLASLAAVLDLDAACVAAVGSDGPSTLAALARHPPPSDEGVALESCLTDFDLSADSGHVHVVAGHVLVVPFDIDLPDPSPAGRVSGVLAAKPRPHRPLTPQEHRLLVAVGNQLALALANARLKELERDRVRSYARLVTWAQEEERKRISRELHDEAAQNLVVIRRSLDTLATELHNGHATAERLPQLQELTTRTLAGLRRFSRDLRPPVLDDLGLTSALDALVDDVRGRSRLELALTINGIPRRVAADTELVLFRIAQAALHNVERHAHATQATIAVTFAREWVQLTVTDDGAGFEPPEDAADLAAGGKLGLLGMQERAQLVGAKLDITSSPGAGTHVTVDVAA
jgi:signal transduction histidine kinase